MVELPHLQMYAYYNTIYLVQCVLRYIEWTILLHTMFRLYISSGDT